MSQFVYFKWEIDQFAFIVVIYIFSVDSIFFIFNPSSFPYFFFIFAFKILIQVLGYYSQIISPPLLILNLYNPFLSFSGYCDILTMYN